MGLVMGRDYVLGVLPLAPVLPLGAFDHAVAADGVDDVIDRLEKTEITTDSYMRYDEKFSSLVVPALVLLLLEVLLLGTRLRKLP